MHSRFPPSLRQYDTCHLPEGFCARVCRHGHPYAQYHPDIIKSYSDPRDFRLIRLNNGLEALLVHDKNADMAAASLCIRTGSVNDPEDIPGLSHLLEHMLFMGSEKYPKENEWDQYLAKKGGECDATTSHEYTDFYFSAPPTAVPGALDRLAHILQAPLFSASSLEREPRAVHSEFEQSWQSDTRRINAVLRKLAKSGHAYSKWTLGNEDTLRFSPMAQGIDVRERLVQHYRDHYSANLMRLVVVSDHSLDTLTEMTVGLFSPLSSSNRVPFICQQGSPMSANWLKHMVCVRSLREEQQLTILFQLSDQRDYFRHEPLEFLSRLIEHEAEGSILAYLKKKGWAHQVMATPEAESLSGYSTFGVTVDLTASGLSHTKEVASSLFAYISNLRQDVGSCRTKFEEYVRMDALNFRYEEPGRAIDGATSWCYQLHDVAPKEETISQNNSSRAIWSEHAVAQALNQLNPENLSILVSCSGEFPGVTLDKREALYDVEYTTRPLSAEHCYARSQDLCWGFSLPQQNPFIPQHVIPPKNLHTSTYIEPQIVSEGAGHRIWHSQELRFGLPKSNVHLSLRSPLANTTARNSLLARLYTDMVEDAFKNTSYLAGEAGISFSFANSDTGVEVYTAGFSDSLLLFLGSMLEHLILSSFDEMQWKRLHDQIVELYSNLLYHHSSSYEAFTDFHKVFKRLYFDAEERLSELQTITAEEVLSFGAGLMRRSFVELYLHGSLSREDATRLASLVDSKLGCLPAQNPPRQMYHVPPTGFCRTVWEVNSDTKQIQSACINVHYIASVEDRTAVVTAALVQSILSSEFFDELRTKRQLGYNVALEQMTEGGCTFLLARVQGRFSPEVLNRAIEDFWASSAGRVRQLSDSQFEDFKDGLSRLFAENFKSIDEEAEYLWSGISDQRQNFDLYIKDAKTARGLTKEGIISMLEQSFMRQETRRKLSLQIRSARLDPSTALQPLCLALKSHGMADLIPKLDACIQSSPTIEELMRVLTLSPSEGPVFAVAQQLLDGPIPDNILKRQDFVKVKTSFKLANPRVP